MVIRAVQAAGHAVVRVNVPSMAVMVWIGNEQHHFCQTYGKAVIPLQPSRFFLIHVISEVFIADELSSAGIQAKI
jgi:hypothetical protein